MKETIITSDGRTITRMELSDIGPITQRERDMIREARKRPVVYDEDCPPLSPAMLEEAERMIAARARRA
ncbi:MAG: hypothetical protein IJ646_14440 [Clostridia bacterium]|nr:hypothetical protein [Clostridia bacterium]